jgi:hypothetical protein
MKNFLNLLIFVSFQALPAMEQKQAICSANSWLEHEQQRRIPSFNTITTQTNWKGEDVAFLDFVQRNINSSPDLPVGNLRLLWEYIKLEMAILTLGKQCFINDDLSDYLTAVSEDSARLEDSTRFIEIQHFLKEGHGDILSLIIMVDHELRDFWPRDTRHQRCSQDFLASFDEKVLQIKGCITTFEKELQRIKAGESQ